MINYSAATSPSSPHRPRSARAVAVAMIAAATSPSGPHPRHACTVAVAVAFTACFNDVAIVAPRLLNTGPEVSAATATACPVHLIDIPDLDDDAEDSGSSVVQEGVGNNPSHVVLFRPSSELLTPPIPENASFAAPVQEGSHPMTSSPLPQYGAQSSVRRESITSVMGAHPGQHVLHLSEPHGRNKQWRMCNQLPLRDGSLLAFLVKATEVSVGGVLTLNILSSTYVWIWREAAAPGENSSSVLKIFVIVATFAMFVLTKSASSMAKAVERDRSCLNVISGFVIVIFVWLVFLGGLMIRCMTGAAIWKIVIVVTVVILIILAVWATTFNHPKILRSCCFSWCCCGRDPKVAAAQASEDEAVARTYTVRSDSAITASVAHDRLEKEAAIAKDRADEARQAHAKAEQEVAAAKNRAEKALSDLQIAQPVNDESAADSGKHEAENGAKEAVNAYRAAQEAAADAKEGALKADADADKKKKEAKEAATIARRERKRTAAAKKVLEL